MKRGLLDMIAMQRLCWKEKLPVDDSILVNSIREKLVSKCSNDSCTFTIFEIPQVIKEFDDGAYRPMILPIGPFHRPVICPIWPLHRGRMHEDLMKEHKRHYLQKVIARSREPENGLEIFNREMKEIEEQARNCYAGNIRMESEEFVEMIVLDGCFIIQLLLQLEDGVKTNEPIYTDKWVLPCVSRDMLLLENQLPFFVLERLWKLACGRPSSALRNSVLTFFRNLLPEVHELEIPNETIPVHHLLHLVHLSLKPASSTERSQSIIGTIVSSPPQPSDTVSSPKSSHLSPKPISPTEVSQSINGTMILIPSPPQPCHTLSSLRSSLYINPDAKLQAQACIDPHDRDFPAKSSQQSSLKSKKAIPPATELQEAAGLKSKKAIPPATELQEAGVEFKKKKAAGSFFDITFKKGLMEMPCLTISDYTNSLFRNLIAFEQCYPNCSGNFTSYCMLMDSLINTPEDVELLKQAGVIEHVLGSDEDVALLFNKLCNGITWDFKNSYLGVVYKEVIQHSQKRWPKWRAKLMRDYFSNPWAILSLIAAIVMLNLTFLQTYFAGLES